MQVLISVSDKRGLEAFAAGLRLRTRFHRAMATAAALFLLCQLPAAAIFDPTASLYHWFIAAIVPTMIALDRKAASAAPSPAPAPASSLSPDLPSFPLV